MLDLFIPAILETMMSEQRVYKLAAQVERLQPAADRQWALEFATYLDRAARVYQMDPFVSLAIAMQESSLNPEAVGPTGDSGIFQVHPGTARRYKIDMERLKHDLPYAVDQHFRILRDKLQACPGKRGWSCYHSKTPHLRKKYEASVLRYLKQA